MRKIILLAVLWLGFLSCQMKSFEKKTYDFRGDIRFGRKYYSIYFNGDGDAYVVKGYGSADYEELNPKTADTSRKFKLQLDRDFFRTVQKLNQKPQIILPICRSTSRNQFYYNHKLIFDHYGWNDTFGNLFGFMITTLPTDYSPFNFGSDEKPRNPFD